MILTIHYNYYYYFSQILKIFYFSGRENNIFFLVRRRGSESSRRQEEKVTAAFRAGRRQGVGEGVCVVEDMMHVDRQWMDARGSESDHRRGTTS